MHNCNCSIEITYLERNVDYQINKLKRETNQQLNKLHERIRDLERIAGLQA